MLTPLGSARNALGKGEPTRYQKSVIRRSTIPFMSANQRTAATSAQPRWFGETSASCASAPLPASTCAQSIAVQIYGWLA